MRRKIKLSFFKLYFIFIIVLTVLCSIGILVSYRHLDNTVPDEKSVWLSTHRDNSSDRTVLIFYKPDDSVLSDEVFLQNYYDNEYEGYRSSFFNSIPSKKSSIHRTHLLLYFNILIFVLVIFLLITYARLKSYDAKVEYNDYLENMSKLSSEQQAYLRASDYRSRH